MMDHTMCNDMAEEHSIELDDGPEGCVCITFQIPKDGDKDQQMIERAKDLAWEFEVSQIEAARQCFRYGIRNYEEALNLEDT